MKFLYMLLTVFFMLPTAVPALSQTIKPDLPTIIKKAESLVHNRNATALNDGERMGLHLDAQADDGIAWIPDVTLTDGVIELDVRGRNAPGQSFVGIVFHASDEQTFESVYLRPFNFEMRNPTRRARSVQYVSVPDYTWRRLREEHPGQYEAEIASTPIPADTWIHLRVVLEGPQVRVYVNESDVPVLAVDRISEQNTGRVGLWVGTNSEGDFANLQITQQ